MLRTINSVPNIIEPEIKKSPQVLFFRAKNIETDKPNRGGDYFSDKLGDKKC